MHPLAVLATQFLNLESTAAENTTEKKHNPMLATSANTENYPTKKNRNGEKDESKFIHALEIISGSSVQNATQS